MDLKQLVVILEKQVSYIYVKHRSAEVNPMYYRQVAAAIRDGRISFLVPGQMQTSAQYAHVRGANRIEFSSRYNNAPMTFRNQSLFVHEASHAVSDLRRIKILRAAEEAVAFVAQAMFLEKNGVVKNAPTAPVPTRRISLSARGIARIYLAGKKASEQAWLDLEQAVSDHPRYKQSARQILTLDGI